VSNFQIKIPKPCSANWVNMNPSFNGRFCTNCQKEVIDFTKFSNAELYQYFEQSGDKVCGKFHQTQLDNFAGHIAQKSNSTWFKVNIIVVSCLTFLWNNGYSKTSPKPNLFYQEDKKEIKRIDAQKSILDSIRISGKVVDTAGLSLPGARVLLKNTGSFVETDKEGRFKINVNNGKTAMLRVGYIGFETQDILVDLRCQENITVVMKEVNNALGMVEIITFKRSLLKRVTDFTKRLFTAH